MGVKVVFDLSANRITVEGDASQDLVAVIQAAGEIAPAISEMKIIRSTDDSPRDEQEGSGNGNKTNRTMREFVRAMSVASLSSKIAAIAYYMKHARNISSFSPKDMEGWFTQCGFEKPSQMPVAFSDAKRKAEVLESVGYGVWRLSNLGDNTIIRKMEDAGITL